MASKSIVQAPLSSSADINQSQRDLALNIPINFVTHAIVSLRSACFPFDEYRYTPALTCFSNLLAANYARFIVDLYWDPSSPVWRLCPAQLGSAQGGQSSSVSPVATASTRTISIIQLSDRAQLSNDANIYIRQISSSGADGRTVEPATLTSRSVTLSTTASASIPSAPSGSSSGVISAGPYSCDPDLTFTAMNQVLAEHFADTSNNVNASLKYLILNLHLATDYSARNPDALSNDVAPLPPGQGLTEVLNATLASYLYTPLSLRVQRANVNNSWYAPSSEYKPIAGYFDTDELATSDLTTPDGWPGEGFIELENESRLIVGVGSVDQQLTGYNASFDAETIFPAQELSHFSNVTFSDSGITRGCYITDDTKPEVTAANNSFALSSNLFDMSVSATSFNDSLTDAAALIHCGLSPFLNTTLLNKTADQDPALYNLFARTAIWSWAPGQPLDTSLGSSSSESASTSNTNNNDNDDSDGNTNHCAAINTSLTSFSKWQVADCGNSYYGLCRRHGNPYSWVLTNQKGVYANVERSCPADTSFDVPRTSLENAFAMRAIEDAMGVSTTGFSSSGGSSRTDDDDDDDGSNAMIWLNFNDLDISSCWVKGVNATCPYTHPPVFKGRTVAVPTVAAIVILAAAALTVFVKCAGNRKMSKRRRKDGNAQWEYEGIPS